MDLIKLEVRCCCVPDNLLGWYIVPRSLAKVGQIRVPACASFEDESFRSVRLFIEQIKLPGGLAYLAINSNDNGIEWFINNLSGFIPNKDLLRKSINVAVYIRRDKTSYRFVFFDKTNQKYISVSSIAKNIRKFDISFDFRNLETEMINLAILSIIKEAERAYPDTPHRRNMLFEIIRAGGFSEYIAERFN